MEIWKPVPNYEGLYEVSNMGRVKALKKTRVVGKDRGFRTYPEAIMRGTPTSQGYLRLKLCKYGKYRRVSIHLLVAHAFLGYLPTNRRIVIDHKNNNPADNRLDNLQIITHRQNNTKDRNRGFSKYVGVYKKGNKFGASIGLNNKKIYLGGFDCEITASEYYQNALIAIESNSGKIKTLAGYVDF